MYEHNALGYWSGLTLCLTKDRSSRTRCPAKALILNTQKIKANKNNLCYEICTIGSLLHAGGSGVRL